MALFLTMPIIGSHNIQTYNTEPTPSVILREDGLPTLAKFKAYDENIGADTFIVYVKQDEKAAEPTNTPYVTPAVQSVALSIEDVQTTPSITPVPIDTANSPKSLTDEQIQVLGSCEAGMDPTKNTGNGYYGAFQFSISTWNSMNTGYERADLAPLDVQIDAVQRLLQRSSIYTQFPACARMMASRGII